jgi:Tfp pilus assembly pilus retraction ATPase PilT
LRGLGLGAGCEQVLLDPEFRSGGLVLICGEHGAGKSTTARSAIVERLKTYGGYCQTVEAPIEVDFEGFHGDGYLEQIDATNTGYAYEVETAMRKFPAATRSMFYFGEVLGEDAAAELARLVPRGNLVFTTIHAKSPEDGIRMLVALAERGGETYARELIASGLKAVVHQRIQKGRPVVQYFKLTEQMRNIISDPNVALTQLRGAIDQASRAASANALRSAAAAQPRMSL